MVIGTGIDLIIAIVFIENQPGIDVGDVTGDIDFFGEDENLWEIVYGIVGLMGDIDVAINGESAVHVHSKGIHKFLASSVASRDEVAATIKLVEIGGAVHGADTSVSLMIELREAEIVLRRSLIRGETGDSVRRISDNGIAEAGFETGQNGGTNARDTGIARFIIVRNREWT